MRETGYYWGRVKDDWDIYYWSGYNWYCFGPDNGWSEEYFDEIDEKQIKRKNLNNGKRFK